MTNREKSFDNNEVTKMMEIINKMRIPQNEEIPMCSNVFALIAKSYSFLAEINQSKVKTGDWDYHNLIERDEYNVKVDQITKALKDIIKSWESENV